MLVETGLWNGRGSGMAIASEFDRYVCIDAQWENVKAAQDAGYDAHFGSSAVVLPWLLNSAPTIVRPRRVEQPALFWLDAHYVKGDAELATIPVPLLAELRAILAWPHAAESVVLIDDVRLLGSPGWPTSEDLGDVLLTVGKGLFSWQAETLDDILRLTPVNL